jgi:hypothetical protein
METNQTYSFFRYLKKVYYRNDKRVAAYLVCLLIATGFWFLNALGKTYTVDVLAPVKYINFPDNKTLTNKQPAQFDLTIRAHGFTILRQKLAFLFMPLEFDVNALTNNRMKQDRKNWYAFPTSQFVNQLSYNLSNDLEILSIQPDTLFFRFDATGHKRVRVKPVLKIGLKKQFRISGDIITHPDSVTVNGPEILLDTLKNIPTEPITVAGVEDALHLKMRLVPAKNIYPETKTVWVNVPVEEYTEAEKTVPVTVANLPGDVRVRLFPSRVKIMFQVSLSRFPGIRPDDFQLTVSYDDILKGKQKLKVAVTTAPAFLYEMKITPEDLEYLIENQAHD